MRGEVFRFFSILLVASIACLSLAQAPAVFTDISTERGIGPLDAARLGSGVAAADFDDDGDVDVFAINSYGNNHQLYRNMGNGEFEEIAASVGLDTIIPARAALWFDYDGDHDLDLFIAGDCYEITGCDGDQRLALFRQDPGPAFVEVTASANLPMTLVSAGNEQIGGIAAGDINQDGYLDLFVGLWLSRASLFLNTGTGSFTNISASSGVGLDYVGHWQPMMYDFNGDGWLDIYVAIDLGPNRLWMNEQNNTFIDMAAFAGVNNAMNDMGVTLGDYDNDGDMDIYVTNGFRDTGVSSRHNVLLQNNSVGAVLDFTELAQSSGVHDGRWGWGTTFMDMDNDGLLDIAATNGFTAAPWLDDPSKFFYNQGGSPPTFADMSNAVQFNDTEWGSALIAFDSDRDGDLDLMQTCLDGGPLRILENSPAPSSAANDYLVIRPRMTGPNHRAIGTVVRVTMGSTSLMRLITAGTSFLGQEPAEAFFGLGDTSSVDSVEVEWPDGTVTTLTNVTPNQLLTVTHDSTADCTIDDDCDDGNFCNGPERCRSGFCSTEAPECADFDPCTLDSCDESLDTCATLPAPAGVEVNNLILGKTDPGTALLSWDNQALVGQHNVYRATNRTLQDLSCLLPGIYGTVTPDDGVSTGSGGVFYYLVTSTNCSGESGLGSGESERVNPAPCI